MHYIVDTSRCLPGKKVYNRDLIQYPERMRDLIGEKAGIFSRHHAEPEQCTSDIGAEAVDCLLKKAGISPGAIDALICATSSPDRIQPATATRIQKLCNLNNAFAFDINSVCSGGVYGLAIGDSLLFNNFNYIIVVACEVYSKILNKNDIRTFPYFGDGAGAVLIGKSGGHKINGFILGSDGSGADIIQVPAGGTMTPYSLVNKRNDIFFTMNGPKVYDFACDKGSEVINGIINKFSINPSKIIAHQANINILKEISLRTNIDFKKFFVNLDRIGNTAGASVLIALDEFLESKKDDRNIIMIGFGGGLSWGGLYISKV